MRVISLVIFILFFSKLAFSEINRVEINKNLFRIKAIIPKVQEMRIEGAKVYEKAIKVVAVDHSIDAELYENINNTTSSILGVEKILMDIERSMKGAHKYFSQNKNMLGLKGTLVLLSSQLLIRDLYKYTLSKFENYKRLRNLINKGDKAFDIKKDSLYKLTKKYDSRKLKKSINKGFSIYEKAKKDMAIFFRTDEGFKLLSHVIEYSRNYKKGETYNNKFLTEFKTLGKRIKMKTKNGKDLASNAANDILGSISGFAGKTVLAYQWRKGTLIKNPGVVKHLKSVLKPLDVANAKIRFKVSGKLIPGFWSHNGLWIGNEKELKEMGIWNHPKIKPYHKEIREGKSFLEAVKTGVALATIEHFIKNIDDVSIMRLKRLKPSQDKDYMAKRILTSIGNIGKQYDFNFNFDYGDKIVCSDVVQLTFPSVKFPIKKSVGRFATTPDSIARAGLSGGDFKVMALYILGNKFEGNIQKRFDDLTINKK